MDIRQLHYFLVLCDEMNYSRAAQRLFLSRQALRQSISALEAEMCGPLFLSAHHKLTLTDRGMSLQRHAAPVVSSSSRCRHPCGPRSSRRSRCASASAWRWCRTTCPAGDPAGQVPPAVPPCGDALPHDGQRRGGGRCGAGELDAGLVIDLGCAAPVLARTTLRADPACLLVPRGHPSGIRRASRWQSCAVSGCCCPACGRICSARCGRPAPGRALRPNAEIGPSFYQAYYLVQEQLCTCLTRYEPGARRELDRVRDVLLEDLPPLCVSLVQRRDHYLCLHRPAAQLPDGGAGRFGQPAAPPRTARKAVLQFPGAVQRCGKGCTSPPVPGTQLDFAGGTNFRELGGYEADEGKHVKWGQIWRGIPTCKLTGEADRAKLDALGLRLILDLRSSGKCRKRTGLRTGRCTSGADLRPVRRGRPRDLLCAGWYRRPDEGP